MAMNRSPSMAVAFCALYKDDIRANSRPNSRAFAVVLFETIQPPGADHFSGEVD
jgi:hypothetical protein